MPFFKPSPTAKFIPTHIKLSKLYYHNTAGKRLGSSILTQARHALKSSGFSPADIEMIITKDRGVSVGDMKKVAAALNEHNVYGFEKKADYTIKDFLNKQRIKAQNIARITKEHVLEAAEEDFSKFGTTSLNLKGVSPNAPKPGESSILARKRPSRAVATLSGVGEVKRITSFGSHPTSDSLSRPTGSGGVSPRPKY